MLTSTAGRDAGKEVRRLAAPDTIPGTRLTIPTANHPASVFSTIARHFVTQCPNARALASWTTTSSHASKKQGRLVGCVEAGANRDYTLLILAEGESRHVEAKVGQPK